VNLIQGDLFEQKCDAICIPTNGFVGPSGSNTMGLGVAGEAKKRWPGIERILGRSIQTKGNRAHILTANDEGRPYLRTPHLYLLPYNIVSFPTKGEYITDWDELLPRYQGQYDPNLPFQAPGWMGYSKLDLITMSALQLVDLTTQNGWYHVYLPSGIGCGAGGLDWGKVRPVLDKILDHRFFIVSLR
jgi:hypothetical protein